MLLALFLTFVGVTSVFGLDIIVSSNPNEPEAIKLVMKELIPAVGLMVGFAWERCFDMGLDTISELHGKYAYYTTHLLELGLLAIVLPAWSKYVQPKAAG